MPEAVPVARRLENVRYAIRNIVAEAARLEAEGREILYCNIGDPLKFDFRTPPHLIEAVTRAMRDGDNGYGASAGAPKARTSVAQDLVRRGVPGVQPEDVIITAGASEAIELAMTALLEPGDEILLPSPGYPLYNAIAAKLGAGVVSYYLDEANGWSLDPARIQEVCTARTRAIVVCNPNNPTGGQYDRRTLEALLEVARRRRLIILSDEIYDRFSYGDPPVPLAALSDDVPVITFNGLSKAYLTCGWRLGWMVLSTPERTGGLKRGVLQLADARLCAPMPAQYAIPAALEGPQDHLAEMARKIRARRDFVLQRLKQIPGLSATPPAGAFYVMPRIELPEVRSDEQFILELVRETGVLFVHGEGFGQKPGTRHFRVVLLPPVPVLETAFDHLESFIRRRYGP
jgi:alanine-synthesizing transaminase